MIKSTWFNTSANADSLSRYILLTSVLGAQSCSHDKIQKLCFKIFSDDPYGVKNILKSIKRSSRDVEIKNLILMAM